MQLIVRIHIYILAVCKVFVNSKFVRVAYFGFYSIIFTGNLIKLGQCLDFWCLALGDSIEGFHASYFQEQLHVVVNNEVGEQTD